ncbi:retrovirus-related pol polyprotein from transposon TNT 1-94 [Tanacetum coccineum]
MRTECRNQLSRNGRFRNPGVQNVGNQNGLIVVSRIANQNAHQNGNCSVVAAQADGNGNGNNKNQIRCYNCRGMGHLARNCTVRPKRRDVAYLQTQLLIAQKKKQKSQFQAEGVSKQKDTTKGTSVNTKFAYQSTVGKPLLKPLRNHSIVRQPNAFQSECLKFSKTRVPPKVVEMNDLSNPVTSVPITKEATVMKNDKVVALGMFRINPFRLLGKTNLFLSTKILQALGQI